MFSKAAVLLLLSSATQMAGAFAPQTAFSNPRTDTQLFQMKQLIDSVQANPIDPSSPMSLDEYLKEDFMKAYGFDRVGEADSELVRRFGEKAKQVTRTAAAAYSAFAEELGVSVSALYRECITELVFHAHFCTSDVRFQRDKVTALGLVRAIDNTVKNYPEPEVGKMIPKAFFKGLLLDEEAFRKDAAELENDIKGWTEDDLNAALKREGDSVLAKCLEDIKADRFWPYNMFFTQAIIYIVETTDLAGGDEKSVKFSNKSSDMMARIRKIMNSSIGKFPTSAAMDTDDFFTERRRLNLMETMMREVEIREKKRKAQRLEKKAEIALQLAEEEARIASGEEEEFPYDVVPRVPKELKQQYEEEKAEEERAMASGEKREKDYLSIPSRYEAADNELIWDTPSEGQDKA